MTKKETFELGSSFYKKKLMHLLAVTFSKDIRTFILFSINPVPTRLCQVIDYHGDNNIYV